MRERVFGVVRAREGGRASARGRVGFADEKAVFALEETTWNELETTDLKILLLLHLQVSAQTKITVLV